MKRKITAESHVSLKQTFFIPSLEERFGPCPAEHDDMIVPGSYFCYKIVDLK